MAQTPAGSAGRPTSRASLRGKTCWNGSCSSGSPPAPQQYNLGKSCPGFAPIGPALVTPDEFIAPDDLELGCTVSGEEMQKARTRDVIFSVPQIVTYLTRIEGIGETRHRFASGSATE